MEDQSLFNNSQPSNGISVGLQNFIDSMVEEIVLEGKPFDTQKKYLKKFSENEGLDYEVLEKGITELIETFGEMKTSDSKSLMKLALLQAKDCHVSEALIMRLTEQAKTQGTASEIHISEAVEDIALFPAKQNGLYGYIDAEGNMVIKPQFENLWYGFKEGLAAVFLGEHFGYIDKSGNTAIEPRFEYAWHFNDGVAVVSDSDEGGYFIINRKGEEVLKGVRYDYLAESFSDGLCKCKVGEKYGFIDKSGKVVIKPQFDDANDFHEGLALVEVNEKNGYIDKSGEMVIKPHYEWLNVGDFEDGMAVVRKKDKWGFINKNGSLVIEPKYEWKPVGFSEGLMSEGKTIKQRVGLLRTEERTKYGFIDRNGNVAIDYRFDDARWFSEGLAAVAVGNKWGYIDKSGNMVIDARYEEASSFDDGWASVQVNGKKGFIDRTGNMVIAPQFKYVMLFRNGLCSVTFDDDTEGYINRSGKVVFKES